MINRLRAKCVAGVLATLCCAPVFASATASVEMSSFSYTLYDLNPLDSVLPSLTLSSSGLGGYAIALTTSESVSDWYPGLFQGASASVTNAEGHAVAGVAGTGSFELQGLSASATSTGAETQAAAWTGYVRFDLSPGSLVSFSSVVSATAATSASTLGDVRSGASGHISVDGAAWPGGWQWSSVNAWANSYQGPPDQSINGQVLTVFFANPSPGSLSGEFSAYVSATAISPVPEPAAFALAISGLSVVGLGRRTRDRMRRREQGLQPSV